MNKLRLPLFILLLSTPVFAEEIPGQALLSYFASNCRTQGEFTRAALDDSMGLIESLRNIQNDPDCKSIGGAIAQMGLLNQQLSQLEKINATKSRIAELENQEQELLIQLANPKLNSSVVTSINLNLSSLQQQRAALIGNERLEKDLSDKDKAEAMIGVVRIANTAFSQLTRNQSCMQKHPDVLNAASSVMATVGATATYVNPALGLGLTAGSVLLGTTIETVRNTKNAREIRRFADTTIAVEGYRCALESMSEKWCAMRDAESFLQFREDQRHRDIMDGNLASAIRINDREIPVLMEWLNKIRSGVTPTTTADAERQNAIFRRETYIRAFEKSGQGRITENRPLFLTANDTNKRKILKALVKNLLPTQEGYFKNPLIEIYSEGYAPYYLLGIPENDESIKNPKTNAFYSLDDWPGFATYQLDYDLVRNQFQSWVNAGREKVNRELSQVLQPDALQTLTSAFDDSGNSYKISPATSLKKIIEFLEQNPPGDNEAAFRKLHRSTLTKLIAIYDLTTDAIINEEENFYDKNTNIVEKIFDLAQLGYGTVVMEARLDLMVRQALIKYLTTISQEDQVLVAQLLASERFTDTLAKTSGFDNPAKIKEDIYSGQDLTIKNLRNFIDLFGNNIGRILFKLQMDERNQGPTEARASKKRRTQLCFLLLAVPNVGSRINESYCTDLRMEAVSRGGPESMVIKAGTFATDMSERACEYHDYFRKTKIHKTWGIK